MLNGGHYIAYAANPSGAWYCYNDSSCREVCVGDNTTLQAPRIDTSSAYILFYERHGLDYSPYLPRATGDDPIQHLEDDEDADLRKQMCTVS